MSKNKGMSRGGRLLALLAVLAVLCGGYFVVTNMTQKEAVIETGGSFEVAGLTPDEITSMAWQNGDETIRLVRADGVWSLDGEANFPLKQDVADELASDIAALEATHTVTGGADAADYGLDEPAFTVTVENDSGDTLSDGREERRDGRVLPALQRKRRDLHHRFFARCDVRL